MTQGWYTFGNHFHWVDMEWLWGNGVLGRSVDDMLAFIERTGAPGNINFDGIGYEKMASEEPRALERLKDAIADGRVEVVGASYGQPYGLFHGGESAIRQLAYGVRAVNRTLETRPRSFWEEEFYFFPQLPQMLVDAGYRYASLFFQWTWHTPEVPKETVPAIRWRGIDGSEILALPRNDLNLHQWPEDIEQLIASGDLLKAEVPVVQQWLELLPSPEWMCRSELVAPGVDRLFTASGVDFSTGTLSTVLDALADRAEVREYGMDDVFHGMSLGKNGGDVHRLSRELEDTILAAEALSVLAGLAGRPYAQWGKYPSWELEEAWRELLAFQHHDNDECEGLCGHVGFLGAHRGVGLARHVRDRNLLHIADGLGVAPGTPVAFNPLGWERTTVVDGQVLTLPPFGAGAVAGERVTPVTIDDDGTTVILRRGDFSVDIDRRRGVATRVGGVDCGEAGLGSLQWTRAGAVEDFTVSGIEVDEAAVRVVRSAGDATVVVHFALAPDRDALDLRFAGDLGAGPDARAHASLMTLVEPAIDVETVFHDTPYAVSTITGRSTNRRKYPSGDWMTSPQEFETITDAFTGLQFVDLVDGSGNGLLWSHDGSQGFHRAVTGFRNVLSMRDPWDEKYYVSALDVRVRVEPHGPSSNAWRWRSSQEFTRPPLVAVSSGAPTIATEAPVALFGVESDPGVAVTALFRESDYTTMGFENHVRQLLHDPVVVRIIEFDGVGGGVTLEFGDRATQAIACSSLGDAREKLAIVDGRLTLDLPAHGIRTVAIELAPAPGENQTLDDHRGTWAVVHRETE